MGAVVLGSGIGLSGCGGGDGGTGTGASTAPSTGQPVRGGTLRAGLTGGSSDDTLNGLMGGTSMDFARIYQLFEPMLKFDDDANIQYHLAENFTPNKDATVWTIELKKGVQFHNGKEMTADDVIFSLTEVANPKNGYGGLSGLATLDVASMKKLDKYTVQLPFTAPYATLMDTLCSHYYMVAPVDFDPINPVGTGPFSFKSFSPGRQSTFDRFDDYWDDSSGPYIDELVITNFADETSQTNALLSGQIDAIDLLSNQSASLATGAGANVIYSIGGGWNPIYVRVDVAPFDDQRVREALRLVADRDQMLQIVFGGQGKIGNDLFAVWDQVYDSELPQREQDLDKAKSLLKAAGHEDLTFDLVTANLAQGVIETAQIYAEQAKGAGITVNLKKIDVGTMYGDNFHSWTCAQDLFYYHPYFNQVQSVTLSTGSNNNTHFKDDHYDALYTEALRTPDVDKRTEIAHEMQQIDYDQGGFIIPYFAPNIDAVAKQVQGAHGSKGGLPLGAFDFKSMWLSG
jgi:peptide/nickel transport system substrate-binding protein